MISPFVCRIQEVVDSGNIHNALGELKNMLNTPIKPYHGPPGCAGDQDPVFHAGSLSPSPSLLMTRGDDTSGCSSLDGSTDSLVTSRIDGDVTKLNKAVSFMGSPPTPAAQSKIVSDMPTVIVSAAPDSDSGGEGSDTSGDDGINLNDLSYSQFSCYAFNGDMIGDVMGQSPVAQEDLPGQITRLLGKSKFSLDFLFERSTWSSFRSNYVHFLFCSLVCIRTGFKSTSLHAIAGLGVAQ